MNVYLHADQWQTVLGVLALFSEAEEDSKYAAEIIAVGRKIESQIYEDEEE